MGPYYNTLCQTLDSGKVASLKQQEWKVKEKLQNFVRKSTFKHKDAGG